MDNQQCDAITHYIQTLATNSRTRKEKKKNSDSQYQNIQQKNITGMLVLTWESHSKCAQSIESNIK